MKQTGSLTHLLLAAGVLGVLLSIGLALFFLNAWLGIAGFIACFLYCAAVVVAVLATAGAGRTALGWLVLIAGPVPVALIVFFALRAFGL